MDSQMSAKLLADFPPKQVGYLPRTWCGACGEATKVNRRPSACPQHEVKPCSKCRTRITTAHVDIDYVGHADVRHRLCEADPEWTWELHPTAPGGPLVHNEAGHPVGMWILLTVGGVTKPGYGSVERGKREAVKELIGDAIRNAAQSFGVAWKHWAKGDRAGRDAQAEMDHQPPARTAHADAEHQRLQPRRQAGDRPADRGPVPPEDDLWAGQPAGEFKAPVTSLPDRKRRSYTPAQLIAMHFNRLGIEDDEERHNWVARMAGRTELASTGDLPPEQQREILTAVAGFKDLGQMQAWIDSKAPAS